MLCLIICLCTHASTHASARTVSGTEEVKTGDQRWPCAHFLHALFMNPEMYLMCMHTKCKCMALVFSQWTCLHQWARLPRTLPYTHVSHCLKVTTFLTSNFTDQFCLCLNFTYIESNRVYSFLSDLFHWNFLSVSHPHGCVSAVCSFIWLCNLHCVTHTTVNWYVLLLLDFWVASGFSE